MKTTTNRIIVLVLAISFLAATNVRAEVLSLFQDKNTYLNTVGPSDWAFGAFVQNGDNFSARVWDFTVSNTLTDAIGAGTLTMSDFNGAGGLMQEPRPAGNGSLSLWHNSANRLDISFGTTDFIDSFYLGIQPHSSWSAAIQFHVTADYWVNGVMHTTDAVTLDMNNTFFGISLDDGAYLASVSFWSIGTPNNGYRMIDLGFGNGGGDVVIPEPATLAIMGLGLAGLAVARRRMKK